MTQWSISLDCFDRGLLRHKPMRKAWALLQRSHLHRSHTSGMSHPHRPRASSVSHPHRPRTIGGSHPHLPRTSGPPQPRATCCHPTRLGRTPTLRGSFHKCPTSGTSRPQVGEGLSLPRASWCSASSLGYWQLPARMADGCASRAPPWRRPQGFLRGGATTDSGQALGRDQGSEWN